MTDLLDLESNSELGFGALEADLETQGRFLKTLGKSGQ